MPISRIHSMAQVWYPRMDISMDISVDISMDINIHDKPDNDAYALWHMEYKAPQ